MSDTEADKEKQPYDLTEKASNRGNEGATRMARELESDDVNENNALGNVTSPNGDDAAENRVTTSLSDD